MKKIIFITVSFLLLFSCINKNPETAREKGIPYYVDVEKYVDNIRPVMLSEIGTSLEYVPLETRPDLMLGTLSNVVLYKDYLIVNDNKQIYMFGVDGKFIRKIGTNGRGPNEYVNPWFRINEFNDWICVLSTKKILCFDLEGNLIHSIDLSISNMGLVAVDNNRFLLDNASAQSPFNQEDTVYNWYIIDNQGNELERLRPMPKTTTFPVFIVAYQTSYLYNDEVHYITKYTDSLFYFSDEKEKLYAYFNLGKRKMNYNEITREDLNNKGEIGDNTSPIQVLFTYEDDFYFYTTLGFGFIRHQNCLFNKKSQEFIQIEDNKFKNDLDGGTDFYPNNICEDNTLVKYEDAFTLLNHINEMEPFEKPGKYKGEGLQLEDLKGIIDENSNPVIILCKRD